MHFHAVPMVIVSYIYIAFIRCRDFLSFHFVKMSIDNIEIKTFLNIPLDHEDEYADGFELSDDEDSTVLSVYIVYKTLI